MREQQLTVRLEPREESLLMLVVRREMHNRELIQIQSRSAIGVDADLNFIAYVDCLNHATIPPTSGHHSRVLTRGLPGMTIELLSSRSGRRLRDCGLAMQLPVDVATAYSDVRAELAALREQTVEEAKELRDLELQRFDEMTAGLWPQIRAGSPPAVSAAVRVSERRLRLLGLDAPSAIKTEISGSLDVYAERLAADRELFSKLDIKQLEQLAAESQALVDRAMMMVRANANALTPGPATAPRAQIGGESSGELAEQTPGTEVDKA